MLLALWAASFAKTTHSEIDLTRNLIEFRIGVRSGSGLWSYTKEPMNGHM